jgi:virginiamycin B lyase
LTSRLGRPNTIGRIDPATEKFQSWAVPDDGDFVRNRDVKGNPVLANSLTNAVGLLDVK